MKVNPEQTNPIHPFIIVRTERRDEVNACVTFRTTTWQAINGPRGTVSPAFGSYDAARAWVVTYLAQRNVLEAQASNNAIHEMVQSFFRGPLAA